MTFENDDVEKLNKEVSFLKKKLEVVTLLGLIFGGGGLFGVYKWYDSERKLTATEIRQNTIQSEITKNEALNRHYSNQTTELEATINKKGTTLKKLEESQKRLQTIKKEKNKINSEYQKNLRSLRG